VITVSLKDVITGGVFGPTEFGMLRSQVCEMLGNPDDWSAQDAACSGDDPWRTSAIWKYGDLEFHFGLLNDDSLALIFMDHFTIPRGNWSITLDPWIIRHHAGQREIEHALRAAHIAFRRIESRYDEEVTGLAIGGHVRLWFLRQDPDADPLLIAFACFDPRLPPMEK
jgi:hypothetical protein